MIDLTPVYVMLGAIIAILYIAFLGWLSTRLTVPTELKIMQRQLERIEQEIRTIRNRDK